MKSPAGGSSTSDFSLDVLAEHPRISDWVFSRIERHLGRRVLDVGCGIGMYTAHLADGGREVVAIDPGRAQVGYARSMVGDNVQFHVAALDEARRQLDGGFDSVVCVNVLEHISDDDGAVQDMRDLLRPGGRIVVLVPAGRWLFGTLDKGFGHERRYSRRDLRDLLVRHGLTDVRVDRFNMLGVPGWFVAGRILRQRELTPSLVGLYAKLMPPFRWFEDKVGAPLGLSLIAVARRP